MSADETAVHEIGKLVRSEARSRRIPSSETVACDRAKSIKREADGAGTLSKQRREKFEIRAHYPFPEDIAARQRPI